MIHSIFTFTDNGESPSKLDANRLEENNDADKFLDKNASNQEQPFWIEDYRCSLCGFELPPCFVEERQEHSDYHLAEKLQREESMHNSGGPAQKQRFVHKAQPNASRKRKSTQQGKHIPIDSFFIKRDQNM
ncbi:hypothetical protein QJS10_CPA05g01213 [Acorus calamus]|uniref:UBZ3-type domain-containing protein n=1 Tax=Acorus calamus TaxID=4465 RepID=A0AAV9ER66_ACOCL|nr:hypothetical protein QJS10_CPA05g01213 [Acorus calamus]